MSKYDHLWEYIKLENKECLIISFIKVQDILGSPIDHSFLTFKKDLLVYGFQVEKISLKNKTILLKKVSSK